MVVKYYTRVNFQSNIRFCYSCSFLLFSIQSMFMNRILDINIESTDQCTFQIMCIELDSVYFNYSKSISETTKYLILYLLYVLNMFQAVLKAPLLEKAFQKNTHTYLIYLLMNKVIFFWFPLENTPIYQVCMQLHTYLQAVGTFLLGTNDSRYIWVGVFCLWECSTQYSTTICKKHNLSCYCCSYWKA